MEGDLGRILSLMKKHAKLTIEMPLFTSIGLEHLLDTISFVKNVARDEFMPWVSSFPSDNESMITSFLDKPYDDLHFHLTRLLVEHGYYNIGTIESLRERFSQGYPWYVDDLYVAEKIVDMMMKRCRI